MDHLLLHCNKTQGYYGIYCSHSLGFVGELRHSLRFFEELGCIRKGFMVDILSR